MPQKLFLPSCHKYIKRKDGTPDSQRIYGVTKSAYQNKFPEDVLDDAALFSFLQCNGVLDTADQIGDLDLEHLELCFSVISQYGCNSICQLCSYSPLFKNKFEREESIILGFCMHNWEHLQYLIENGIHCRYFRAMIPVSEKSAVSVIPLNRLAFEYLETIPQSQADLDKLVPKIIGTIKHNNKDKLSVADLKIASAYLQNLYDQKAGNTKQSQINDLIKKCFGISCNLPETSKPTTNVKQKPTDSQKTQTVTYLSGFLADKPSANKKSLKPSEIPPTKTRPIPPPLISAKKETAPSSGSKPPAPEPTTAKDEKSVNVKGRLLSTYTPIVKKDMSVSRSVREVMFWTFDASDKAGYPAYNMDTTGTKIIADFLQDLLLTPLLPMEIVETKDGIQQVLLYAQHRYYYFSLDNSELLEQMLPYLEKSCYRKILCYEPFLLYSYFWEHEIYQPQLFSIRTAMDHIGGNSTYWGMAFHGLSELFCGFSNIGQIQGVMNALQSYPRIYQKITGLLGSLSPVTQADYSLQVTLDKIVGCSFRMARLFFKPYLLFSQGIEVRYCFLYENQKIRQPYMAVKYVFLLPDNCTIGEYPIEKLLELLSHTRMFLRKGVALLCYAKNTLTLAITPEEYHFVCDTINNISVYLAEQYNFFPVHIIETPASAESVDLS